MIDLVTHFFPPVGGPASRRLAGWAAHFVESGIGVRVTTPAPDPRDPYFDPGLAPPAGVQIRRVGRHDLARSWRGRRRWSRLLRPWRDLLDLPDHRRIWNPVAVRSLDRADPPPAVLVTTSPYNSTHLIGLRLKRRSPGLIWVADFRDTWFQQWDRRLHTPLHRSYGRRLEREVAGCADRLVFFHHAGIDDLASRVGAELLADKAVVAYSGYGVDAEARLSARTPDVAASPLRLGYAGTIWEWNLPPGFLAALRGFRAALRRGVELHLCGRIEPGPLATIGEAARAEPGSVVVHGYLPRTAALDLLAEAAVLLVFSGPYRESVSSKLFECIAARRPILYFGRPDSAGAEILRSTGAAGGICERYDEWGVRAVFDRLAAAVQAGTTASFAPARVPRELSSRSQNERVLACIREAVAESA